LFNRDRTLFPADEIVEMATIGGARALNMDRYIGSIEPGKKADIVIFETSSVNMQPVYNYYSTIVYAANAGNVNTVIVDGKILVNERSFTEFDLISAGKEFKNLSNKIMKEAESLGS
jgi:cytosine/adenosine deaminase-related metal-dependent hydrolase